MDREISWIGTRGCAELPFPESGKVFGKLRNLMNSFNLFARRDEISRDAAPVREETAVTPSSASRPTLSSGENPQDKERNVFGEGLRIDGDVSSDTDIVIRGTVHGSREHRMPGRHRAERFRSGRHRGPERPHRRRPDRRECRLLGDLEGRAQFGGRQSHGAGMISFCDG